MVSCSHDWFCIGVDGVSLVVSFAPAEAFDKARERWKEKRDWSYVGEMHLSGSFFCSQHLRKSKTSTVVVEGQQILHLDVSLRLCCILVQFLFAARNPLIISFSGGFP